MGERTRGGKRMTKKKEICLYGGGSWRGWWLGGHENVNLDVSEAIYSSLGIQSGGREGRRRGIV